MKLIVLCVVWAVIPPPPPSIVPVLIAQRRHREWVAKCEANGGHVEVKTEGEGCNRVNREVCVKRCK